jgi:nucleoside-diphosphate kinase
MDKYSQWVAYRVAKIRGSGHWLLVACCWITDAGFWIPDAGIIQKTINHKRQTSLLLRRKKQIRTMSNRTLTMIKPDAMKKGYAGGVLDMMIQGGFRVVALKQLQLTPEKAGEFYAVHKERPFYGELVEFMSSGPIIAAILEKENAVADFRKLIGATNPANAEEGTIRKKYASSVGENAVHGSDSDENAKIEGDFFFSALERF